jgi:uncharacterized membrane protein YbhN (UPF0104 family)
VRIVRAVLPFPLAGVSDFFDAVDQFFSDLAHVKWAALAVALVFFTCYLSLRARASFNILRAAYPTETFRYKDIWAAYFAGYGFNSVIPARGGDVIRLFLTKTSVPRSSYPAVASSFFVENVFDLTMAVFILTFAFTQGVFPKPPDFASLDAFDLSYFAQHPRFALFTITALAVLALAAVAILSARVRRFWERVKQGLTVLYDRNRYFREVWAVQFAGWLCRFTAFWFLLEAFHIGGSVKNVLLVLGVNAVAAAVPFTPGGAGVQQALLVKVFGGSATAYSVGQQIAIAAWTFGVGFLAIAIVFRMRSFKEVMQRGREDRAKDKQMRAESEEKRSEASEAPA